MIKEKYSIADIAMMTRLSDRTIRTYIKNGLLQGEKYNGLWLFSKDDVKNFLNHKYVKSSVQIKNNALVNDFMIINNKRHAAMCCIYDYPVENEEVAKIICERIINEINKKDHSNINMSYNYDNKNNIIRLIGIGNSNEVIDLIQKCQL